MTERQQLNQCNQINPRIKQQRSLRIYIIISKIKTAHIERWNLPSFSSACQQDGLYERLEKTFERPSSLFLGQKNNL